MPDTSTDQHVASVSQIGCFHRKVDTVFACPRTGLNVQGYDDAKMNRRPLKASATRYLSVLLAKKGFI